MILIFQVLRAVNMNITVFCDVTYYSMVDEYQCFRTCWLHLQGRGEEAAGSHILCYTVLHSTGQSSSENH
jgi:hypothetical protein